MKSFILTVLVAITLTACTNYGKKVKTGDVEVYYKDGVTEEQAKKISFLFNQAVQQSNPGATGRKSFQVTKPSDSVLLKMVVDKSKLDKIKDNATFYAISGLISDSVFNGQPVNIMLTDDRFKPLRTLAFRKPVKVEDATGNDNIVVSKDDFDHDKAGGIDFYWKGISDEESKTIADYIVKNGAFGQGPAELYMTKKGDRYIIRFPMIESARTDPTYINALDKLTKEIKDNVFANVPFSFFITDEDMNTVKYWDY